MSTIKVSTSNGVTTLRKNLKTDDDFGWFLAFSSIFIGVGLGFALVSTPDMPLSAIIIVPLIFIGGGFWMMNSMRTLTISSWLKRYISDERSAKKIWNSFQWKTIDLGTSQVKILPGDDGKIIGQGEPNFGYGHNLLEYEVHTKMRIRPFRTHIVETHALTEMGLWDEAMSESMKAYPFEKGYSSVKG